MPAQDAVGEAGATLSTDVAVIGAGAAGLWAALVAAREGAQVVLVSRSTLAESASYWAQGGVAAALAADDSPERHARDSLTAGRGTARPSAIEVLCREAPESVRELLAAGVRFDADRHGELVLGLEGGHSARRVVHAGGSATGRRITRQLSALAAEHPRIRVLEGTTAGALWTDDGRCVGLTAEGPGGRTLVRARGTIVATGGAAALWQRTTNPRGAIGAGLTLAHAAGAELADLELVQFHPTALVAPNDYDGFLITEAIRGEGATLLDERGERFVDELAPRDEVALAIEARLRADSPGTVRLDMRAVDLDRFPNVDSTLQRAGFDARRAPVPVAPASHYTMGGIATDTHGRASVAGLYAVGECGGNGLHGANRLASNSLAECFVFGRRAALAAASEPPPAAAAASQPPATVSPVPPRPTRAALWRLAGLERSAEGLRELASDPFPLARAIAESALLRAESRGAHQRRDRPNLDPSLDGMHAVVPLGGRPRFERWE